MKEKDPTKLYLYLPKITEVLLYPKENRTRLLLGSVRKLSRHRAWRDKIVIVSKSLERADVAFCPTDKTLKEVKGVRPNLYCFVPKVVCIRNVAGSTQLGDLMLHDLEEALALVMVGIDLRANAPFVSA